MIRTNDAVFGSRARTREEAKWLLLAAGQTALLLLGLALVVLAAEAWTGSV